MFDLGWTEILVIGLVAIIVIGPKDLPKVLRAVTKAMSWLRGIVNEVRSNIVDIAHEADLDDIKNQVTKVDNSEFDDILEEARVAKKSVEEDLLDLKNATVMTNEDLDDLLKNRNQKVLAQENGSQLTPTQQVEDVSQQIEKEVAHRDDEDITSLENIKIVDGPKEEDNK